ncbi:MULTISPECIES: hypothetical protein [unclassified Streptomyces]|uniref:hypothetical protein n=1 Tax=unclassified Streptomyces TaxID=2593676 RepID=UPI003806337C
MAPQPPDPQVGPGLVEDHRHREGDQRRAGVAKQLLGVDIVRQRPGGETHRQQDQQGGHPQSAADRRHR